MSPVSQSQSTHKTMSAGNPMTSNTPKAAAVSLPKSSLQVYNTLTRTKEQFQTVVPGEVKMYLCGPTVYKPAHIGHMVGPVIFDTMKRYLTYAGY